MVPSLARRLSDLQRRAAALAPNGSASAPGLCAELQEITIDLARVLGDFQTAEKALHDQNRYLAQAKLALDVERRRYQDLFEFAPDGYFVTNARGIISEANRAAALLVNYPLSYLAGLPMAMLVAQEDRTSFCSKLAGLHMRADVELLSGWELRLRPRNRPIIVVDVTAAVMRDQEERCIGLRWLLRDVTKVKQAERLAAIGQMVAGLAHESRNALQRSQACLEMLALEVHDRPRALDLMARLQKAQDHLQRQYEELRQFAAPVQLERRPCRLSDRWREAWSILEPQHPGRHLVLREQVGEDDRCLADPLRLTQVFRIVLENAVAAAPDAVDVRINCTTAIVDHQTQLRVSIRDNGPGIPVEQRERVFEPFFTTKLHGTGLGLAVAKRYVEAHGGRITASTAPEGGAEIVIVLPRGNP
jgi:PAS domain S-box-containing protein